MAELGNSDFDGREEIHRADRFDQIAEDPGVLGLVDDILLAVCRKQQDRCQAFVADHAGRMDAVQAGHLDVQEDDVRLLLAY